MGSIILIHIIFIYRYIAALLLFPIDVILLIIRFYYILFTYRLYTHTHVFLE